MKHEISTMKTKKSLADSLRRAMEKKTFSKITVSEIIEDCGVNRKTFYYHFHDIYDLLRWMLDQDAIEIVKKFDLIEDYEEAITFVMNYVEENEHIINCAYDAIGHDHVKSFFYADFIALINALIIEAENRMNSVLNDNYRDFLSKFYTEALSGMLMEWISKKNTVDRQQIIDYISSTIRISLIEIIKNLGTANPENN